MSSQVHLVVRKKNSVTERLAWKSPATGNTFCGICLRSQVGDDLGSECKSCGSQVVGRFESVQGGRPRVARARERVVAVDRNGNVLTMRAS